MLCEATLTDEQYQELVDEYNKDVSIQKMGLTDFYKYHIKVLTEEICNGCYHSQDSEEYKKTHSEYNKEEDDE